MALNTTAWDPIPGFQVDVKELYKFSGAGGEGRDFKALGKAMEGSFRGLENARNLNQNLVESYAGPAYGTPKDKRKRYLYNMQKMTTAYMMKLAANSPVVEIEPNQRQLEPFANHFAIAINNLIKEIGLEHTIRRWVLDAFFSMGVIKVHMKDSGPVEFETDLWMDPGSPFASNVSLDDFAYDMSARTWGEIKWAADKYRVPLSYVNEAVETGMFDPEVAKNCKATSKYFQGHDKLATISTGDSYDSDEYEPMVDLCDVWIKRENCIYTFVVTNVMNFTIEPKPLAKMEWDARDTSPYHILSFNDVPENVLPVGPAVVIDELDRLSNSLMRKQVRQATRQKSGIVYMPGLGAETGKRWSRANDGEDIAGNPDSMKPFASGGAHPGNQLFLADVLRMIDEEAGNLTSLLGLGSQAETLGQEELIHSASNTKIGQMQYRVLEASQRLIRSLGLMLWEDEFKEISGQITVEGTDYRTDSTWRPGDREGNFLDYNFKINVFSMSYQPPMSRAGSLIDLLTRVYIPVMDQIAAQGGMLNWAKINETLANLMNQQVLKDILQFSGAPTVEEKPSVSTKSSGPTERTYTRKSVPSGEADKMRSQQMTKQWMTMGQGQPQGSAA